MTRFVRNYVSVPNVDLTIDEYIMKLRSKGSFDVTEGYIVGASIKDADKEGFAVTRMEDTATISGILSRLGKTQSGSVHLKDEDI